MNLEKKIDRAVKKKKKVIKRLPAPPRGLSIEIDYYKNIKKMTQYLISLIKDFLIPNLKYLTNEHSVLKPDKMDDLVSTLERIMSLMRIRFNSQYSDDEYIKIATKIANEVDMTNVRYFNRLSNIIAIDALGQEKWLESELRVFVKNNVNLIRNIPTEYFNKVENIVLREVPKGTLAKDIAEKIKSTYDMPQNKAKLIARDQTAKLNGSLNQLRQKEAGVEKFEWSAVMDNRTRPEHEHLNGKIFYWNDPPAEGYPSEPINCRCVAIPIIEITQ